MERGIFAPRQNAGLHQASFLKIQKKLKQHRILESGKIYKVHTYFQIKTFKLSIADSKQMHRLVLIMITLIFVQDIDV